MSEETEDDAVGDSESSKGSSEESGDFSCMGMYRKTVRKPWEVVHTDEGTIKPIVFPDGVEPARVSVSLGLTINLGDYESAKISVTCTLPTPVEGLEDAFDAAREFAGTKLIQVKKEVDTHLRGIGEGKKP